MRVPGVVVRQRPTTAKGFVFITMEDEDGLKTDERDRQARRPTAVPQGAAQLLLIDRAGDDAETRGNPQRLG